MKINEDIERMIFNEFKDIFISQIEKGIVPQYQSIKSQLALEYGLSVNIETPLIDSWFDYMTSLNFFSGILRVDTNIEEIMIHSPQNISLVGSHASICLPGPSEDIFIMFQYLTLTHRQNWNYQNPFSSFTTNYMGFQLRITLIHESLSPSHMPKAFIRILGQTKFSLEDFCPSTNEFEHIKQMLEAKENVIICGSTGSGKTSLLNAMMAKISLEAHTVIMEDTDEIICRSPFWTKLLSQNGIEGKTLRDFCTYALRISPQRMILGEMRSHEVVPFILAMNSGHKGLLSTIHANSAQDAISRLALLFCINSNTDLSFNQVQKLVVRNVDRIIFVENKKIKEMIRPLGVENDIAYFEKSYTKSEWAKASASSF